ncbi:uncharacterized protein C8R40DRAFT_1165136 [Lentinula edodes]|uniref:uncharacterized protein n=1 Tax=Lentinula edodes TaxID=5353 RepID=UPI001E8E6513|nr:uncharacterized protein C8R40DRAFT_1165136 [Lentinula edodes]KAH7880230.1 hypothetical protein C8R40DRAFT_1165136 [Lentinula edodes]KAJ3911148.1 hypothetical protein F5877DRAFT_86395 [Lentinula edodes]
MLKDFEILPTSRNGATTATTTLSSISELGEIRIVPETDSQNLDFKKANTSLAMTTIKDISHNNNAFYDHPAEDFWMKSTMRPPNLSISQEPTRGFTENHNQDNDLTSPCTYYYRQHQTYPVEPTSELTNRNHSFFHEMITDPTTKISNSFSYEHSSSLYNALGRPTVTLT